MLKPTLIGLILTLGLAQAQPLKVGVIHKQSLVVAYYGSPLWSATMKVKMAEQQAAKQAGDAAKVAELEKWGQASQDLAHRQLAGEAPIDDILAALKPALPEIARRAGVSLVVVDLPYAAEGVEVVDATPALLDHLSATARVRKNIDELRKMNAPVRVH